MQFLSQVLNTEPQTEGLVPTPKAKDQVGDGDQIFASFVLIPDEGDGVLDDVSSVMTPFGESEPFIARPALSRDGVIPEPEGELVPDVAVASETETPFVVGDGDDKIAARPAPVSASNKVEMSAAELGLRGLATQGAELPKVGESNPPIISPKPVSVAAQPKSDAVPMMAPKDIPVSRSLGDMPAPSVAKGIRSVDQALLSSPVTTALQGAVVASPAAPELTELPQVPNAKLPLEATPERVGSGESKGPIQIEGMVKKDIPYKAVEAPQKLSQPGRIHDADLLPHRDTHPVTSEPAKASPAIPAATGAPAPASTIALTAVQPDRSTMSRWVRSERGESAPDVTITLATPGDSPDLIQAAPFGLAAHKDPGTHGGGLGRESSLSREDSLPPLTSVEGREAKRAAEVTAPRIDTAARPVLTQLVQAARSAIDGMVEVKLSPEELGRVRLVMTGGEAGSGMNVIVTAERAETLDLIRRNIDLFAADLAEQGFTNLNFSFGGESADGDNPSQAEGKMTAAAPEGQNIVLEGRIVPSGIAADGRVDLRL